MQKRSHTYTINSEKMTCFGPLSLSAFGITPSACPFQPSAPTENNELDNTITHATCGCHLVQSCQARQGTRGHYHNTCIQQPFNCSWYLASVKYNLLVSLQM